MYPTYVIINNEKYDINTDFKVAIECNKIAQDETISDFERALAIIYKLFGDKGINDSQHYDLLLEKSLKYLSCGKEVNTTNNEEPDMDYIQDMSYIEASFMSDYHIDLTNTKMHWWKFNNLINGLSYSDDGNCCILNRIRSIRTLDLNEIKDNKSRQKLQKIKEDVALDRHKTMTEEQKRSSEEFYKNIIL